MARVLALVSILVLAGASAAAADEDEDYAGEGFYVGASIAGASYTGVAEEVKQRFGAIPDNQVCMGTGQNQTCYWAGYDVTTSTDASAGVNGRVGYRVLPRLAAEVQFEWLSQAQVDVAGDFDQNNVFELNSWVVTANAKGYMIPTGRVQPFLSAGVGMIHVNSKENVMVLNQETQQLVPLDLRNDDNGFVLRMGGGVDVYFTPHVALVLDASYVLPTGGVAPFDYVAGGIGVQYRF